MSTAARRCLKADLNVLSEFETRLGRVGLIESISCPSFLPTGDLRRAALFC
jgi:hypothetical protein